jgi:hypothetical protein
VGRTLALWLLGLWLGLLLASWAAATINFRTADRLAAGALADARDPAAATAAEGRRAQLRHVAAEANRWMFRWWALAQLPLGAVALAVMWRSPAGLRATIIGSVVITLVQAMVLGPAMESLGRGLDFAARPWPPEVARRFGLLHGGYVVLDFLKALLLGAAAIVCARRG